MKSYAAIKAEIAKLEKQADEARRAEVAGVIGRIKEAIAAYSLTAEDLGLKGTTLRARVSPQPVMSTTRRSRGAALYRDPATGKTWTGQGRPPGWILDAEDRTAFLIGSNRSEPRGKGASKGTRQPGSSGKTQTGSKKSRAGSSRRPSSAASQTAAAQVDSGASSE